MKDWQDLDLAIFLRVKWQDLGQDPRSCHFFCVKMARSRARSMFKLYGDIMGMIIIRILSGWPLYGYYQDDNSLGHYGNDHY